jgi:transglutaminase-like putative cysteine protease
MTRLTARTAQLAPGAHLLAPLGMTTPHDAVTGLEAAGGRVVRLLREPELGLAACEIAAEGGPLTRTYAVAPPPARRASPPRRTISPRRRRTSRRRPGGGAAGTAALVTAAEARFAYGHPETRFNDGAEAVPYLACGLTVGACVDINTWLVASLRAAGYEAAYLYGYFFQAERGGVTNDMHCWVATRHDGEVLEWDIAHHM